ncbi:MAG: hypothetical protein HY824_02705 [Acidobacteria bacterium]|nr:hypothetical protein [Acidobacteriota bacterium]
MPRSVLLGVVLVTVCAIGPTAARAPESDLVGSYRCEGVNPDGTAYQGVVEIAKVRETFRVKWTLDDGAVLGIGIYSGGVFAVSYFGGAPAVVVYKMDGSRLVGEWTMGGIEGAVYTETLTKTSSEPPGQLGPTPGQRQPGGQRPRRDRQDPDRPTEPGSIRL